MKFTFRGRIELRINYDPENKLLTGQVKDTGAGIDRDDISKLFSRFGKFHRAADNNHDGIGLGLTIVRQIIIRSGGAISAESKGLGHGSKFFFSMRME